VTFQLNVKFPDGMSQRDKNIIKAAFLSDCQRHPPQSQAEVHDRFRAFVGEHFINYGTIHHGKQRQ
jgi:hypothetical protein